MKYFKRKQEREREEGKDGGKIEIREEKKRERRERGGEERGGEDGGV